MLKAHIIGLGVLAVLTACDKLDYTQTPVSEAAIETKEAPAVSASDVAGLSTMPEHLKAQLGLIGASSEEQISAQITQQLNVLLEQTAATVDSKEKAKMEEAIKSAANLIEKEVNNLKNNSVKVDLILQAVEEEYLSVIKLAEINPNIHDKLFAKKIAIHTPNGFQLIHTMNAMPLFNYVVAKNATGQKALYLAAKDGSFLLDVKLPFGQSFLVNGVSVHDNNERQKIVKYIARYFAGLKDGYATVAHNTTRHTNQVILISDTDCPSCSETEDKFLKQKAPNKVQLKTILTPSIDPMAATEYSVSYLLANHNCGNAGIGKKSGVWIANNPKDTDSKCVTPMVETLKFIRMLGISQNMMPFIIRTDGLQNMGSIDEKELEKLIHFPFAKK